ncbi:MAG: hypothetical protein P8M30_04125 [Planctomycetaceae bacterium]|jgi:small multidrug resistance pump|nr:hypothetical protein [Planctomycetaceae bacterium]
MNHSRWKSRLLIAAAVHCGLWGLFIVGWPDLSFQVYGYTDGLTNTLVWQGCGFAIFMYGLGYALASTDPYHHYGLVLIGAVAKTCGTLGVLYGYLSGQFLLYSVAWVFVNDILWIVPFAFIVKDAVHSDGTLRTEQAGHESSVWFDWLGV